MALYVAPNGSNWIIADSGLGATGAVHGFASETGRPLWRHPITGHWVDGTGEVFAPSGTGYTQFYTTTNSGLLAAL